MALDRSAEILRGDFVAAKAGTRVATAVGPFQWSKAFGWKIGMWIFSVQFEQHERQQPLRSPVPCWTFAAVPWSFPSVRPRRR